MSAMLPWELARGVSGVSEREAAETGPRGDNASLSAESRRAVGREVGVNGRTMCVASLHRNTHKPRPHLGWLMKTL